MKKEIIINATLNEVRVAITEDKKLAEFFIELPDHERSVGNIYYGKVNKIVTGINAAFVDIGLKNDAFLHFSDIDESYENVFTDDDDTFDTDDDNGKEKGKPKGKEAKKDVTTESSKGIGKQKSEAKAKSAEKSIAKDDAVTFNTKKSGKVQIKLEQGQGIVVQVIREAYSTKGVKITTKIGIPGRNVILLPFDNILGISRKIQSYQERKRLRFLAKNTLPEGFGCIIRTAAANKTESELKNDWDNLVQIWKEIEKKIKKGSPPMLLYEDMTLAKSVIRDLLTKDVTKVHIDSKKLYKEITGYLKWVAPNLVEIIELYQGKEPIFDAFDIENELETTYQKKVLLPSGGSVVIEPTEAMLIIDVNSGRSQSERLQEKTALNTNLEAIHEIAKQLRLRDIGGMILVDCIDMSQEANRKKIYQQMRKEMLRDRAKSVVYPLTQLNILQITRQRINQAISEKISDTCPMCRGTGRVTSKAVLMNSIERWLKSFRSDSNEFRLRLTAHPYIIPYLMEGTISRLSKLMIKYFARIKIQQDDNIRIDDFRFYSYRRQKDITQEYL